MIAICTLSIAKISDCKREWCLLLLMFSVYPRKAQKVFIIAILVKKFRKTLVIIRFGEINVQSKDKNQKDSSGTKCLSVR